MEEVVDREGSIELIIGVMTKGLNNIACWMFGPAIEIPLGLYNKVDSPEAIVLNINVPTPMGANSITAENIKRDFAKFKETANIPQIVPLIIALI